MVSNYIGFMVEVPQFLSPMFFKRCERLGYIFNNGNKVDSKLQDYKDCLAYIFWDGLNNNPPYVGSNIDYENDPGYYAKYVNVKLSIFEFMTCTRFKNIRKLVEHKTDTIIYHKSMLDNLMRYGERIDDNT